MFKYMLVMKDPTYRESEHTYIHIYQTQINTKWTYF